MFTSLLSHCSACSHFIRLTGTAWNLAQNKSKRIVGFSGTNDNHRILPLQVRQYFASKDKVPDPILNDLDGTNGKMIEMMLEHTVAVRQLGTEAPNSDLLVNLIKEGITGTIQIMHALIDCGALLAGTDLLDFSKRILVLLPMDEFGGVLFLMAQDLTSGSSWSEQGDFFKKISRQLRKAKHLQFLMNLGAEALTSS
jgi:hypothetical protein